VTDRLLLDTHIVLWLNSGSERLLSSTRRLIDECRENGGTILLSAISAWEIGLLVEGGRIQIDLPVEKWVRRFLNRTGVEAAPLGWRAASLASRLHHLDHRDPADRLLIATAIDLSCPLVTYDDRISRFGKKHGSQYGFEVAG
jgi:PIN domain nuclease of toxin-antitoxin system